MLREGWDVRNVSVVLGLRPFTAKAEILPEQVIGRGLRPMTGIGPDRTQTREVLGTRNLLNVLREQLEAEAARVYVDQPVRVLQCLKLATSSVNIFSCDTDPRHIAIHANNSADHTRVLSALSPAL